MLHEELKHEKGVIDPHQYHRELQTNMSQDTVTSHTDTPFID